jgi:hypothetical protein
MTFMERDDGCYSADSPAMLTADGFDAAAIGVARRLDWDQAIIAYDYDKCVKILENRDGMSTEEAIEYMDFNVVGSYVGAGTPCFIHPGEMEEFDDE